MNPTALFGTTAGIAAWSMLSAQSVPKMHEKKSSVALVRLDPGLKDDAAYPGLRFQYFPESISDSRSINYSQKQVPGGSLPLYQWINGGERTISFTATFSTDVDISLDSGYVDEIKSLGLEDRNVDIKAALIWLRSYMAPFYLKDRMLPPPKLLLWIPGSGIGLMGGAIEGQSGNQVDSVVCVMTQCDIEMKAFFPSGTPRFATVQLAFAQVPQVGGIVTFPGWVEDLTLDNAISDGVGFDGGYKLTPKT